MVSLTDLDAHEIQSVDTVPEPLHVSGQLITAGNIGTLKSNSKWLVPGHIFIVTVTVSVSLQQSVSHCNSLVMSMYSEIQLLPLGMCMWL